MTVKLLNLCTNEDGGHDPDDFFESGGKVVLEDEDGTVHIEYSQRCRDNFLLYRWTAEVWDGRPEWWSKTLDAVARTYGADVDEMRSNLKSLHPLARAYAYIDIADCYGLMNFDRDPLRLTPFEMTCRYSRLLDIKIPLLDEILKARSTGEPDPAWPWGQRMMYRKGRDAVLAALPDIFVL